MNNLYIPPWELTNENIIENGIDKDAYGFIYDTRCLVNGYHYFGQKKFIYGWEKYLGSGKGFLKAVKELGKDNFVRDIVEIAWSAQELNELEIKYIEHVGATKKENYYNISTGGHNGNAFAGKTKKEMIEIGKKISESLIRVWDNKSIEEKASIANKRSKSMTGRFNGMFNKHHSEETKQKMRESKTGENNPHTSRIICKTTGEVFECIIYASKKYGITRQHISRCCKGRRRSAGKHPETGEKMIWEYYN